MLKCKTKWVHKTQRNG